MQMSAGGSGCNRLICWVTFVLHIKTTLSHSPVLHFAWRGFSLFSFFFLLLSLVALLLVECELLATLSHREFCVLFIWNDGPINTRRSCHGERKCRSRLLHFSGTRNYWFFKTFLCHLSPFLFLLETQVEMLNKQRIFIWSGSIKKKFVFENGWHLHVTFIFENFAIFLSFASIF